MHIAANSGFWTDAIIEAQEAVMDAKIRAEQVKNYRPTPLQEENFDVQTPQAQPSRAEPDEKTLRWQAKNQWFGQQGFEEYTSYALGLHQKLVDFMFALSLMLKEKEFENTNNEYLHLLGISKISVNVVPVMDAVGVLTEVLACNTFVNEALFRMGEFVSGK